VCSDRRDVERVQHASSAAERPALGRGRDRGALPARQSEGSAVELAAAESAIEFTAGLKRVTRRERPNGHDDQSMPSDHAATAAVYASLAADNLRLSGVSGLANTAADAGLTALTLATGWARVEAGAHFPSDSLVGAAIGSFFATFATAAFLAPLPSGPGRRLQIAALPGGGELCIRVQF
jgi:membrane-associated phospholipid phosphatase